MSRKYLLILVTILIIIIFTILVVIIFKSSKDSEITIENKDNEGIKINNIYQDPIEITPGAVTITRTTDLATYFYNEDGNKFTITLNEGTIDDFLQKKPLAEQEFLNILGVSQSDACKLNVQVLNGGSFDPELQGKSFPLNFCSSN
jgi:hypothetical protein